MKLLSIKNLNKEYTLENQSIKILNDISFEMETGEFVAIMGPSGCGKSTFLYTASGMDSPTSGKVSIAGKVLEDLSPKELSALRLQKMGFIFQQMYLMKNLNLYDNIILPAYILNKKDRQKVNEYAIKYMKLLGIEQIKDNYYSQTSGGQLQRACICRAIINEPEILFVDEPTGALNSNSAKDVMCIFTELHRQGISILLVTHDNKIAAYAQKIIYLLDGKIHSEILLGTYKESDKINRNKQIQEWLEKIEI